MKIFSLIFFIGLVLISVLINLDPYLGFDAASFYYGGLVISSGGVPYLDFIDNKGPAIFYLLSLPAAIYKWNVLPALLIFRAIDILLLLLLVLLLRYFVQSFWVLMVALLSFWIAYLNTFASTYETIYCEMPEVLTLLISYLLAINGRSNIVIGLLLGVATLFRQPAILHSIVILVINFSSPKQSFKININLLKNSMALFLGVVVVLFGVLAIAWNGGWLQAWWHSTFIWPLRYMQAYPSFWSRIPSVALHLFDNDYLVPFGIGVILWGFLLALDLYSSNRENFRSHIILTSLLFVGAAEVSLTGKVWRHHFITWLPALTCLLGFTIDRFILLFAESRKQLYQSLLLLILVLISIRPGIRIFQEMVSRLDFFQEKEVARCLGNWFQSKTNPDQSVYIWGFAPQIYLQSRRFAGIGQFHNLLLTNLDGAFQGEQVELISQLGEDLRKNSPDYILLLSKLEITKIVPWIKENYKEGKIVTPYGGFKYLYKN